MTLAAIESSIRVLEDCGELGATDCRRLFDLLPSLDAEGCIAARAACTLLFKDATADASLRAFVQRVKHAINTATVASKRAADDPERQARLEVLQAFSLASQRESGSQPKQLVFSALDQPMAISPSANRSYRETDFVSPSAAPEKLRLFISYARADRQHVDLFLQQLERAAKDLLQPPLEPWIDTHGISPGTPVDTEIQKAIRSADYGLALLSKAFFDSDYILDHELPYFLGADNPKRLNLIPVTLESIEGNCDALRGYAKEKSTLGKRTAELQQLLKGQWFELREHKQAAAFGDCMDDGSKQRFVEGLLRSAFGNFLQRNLPDVAPPRTPQGLSDISRKEQYLAQEAVDAQAAPIAVQTKVSAALSKKEAEQASVKAVEVIPDMLNWATATSGDTAPPLYALLGGFGMGKTFACREFARRFNHQSQTVKAFYIDLRDTPSLVDTKGGLRVPTLEEIIACILKLAGRPCEVKDVETVIAQVRSGRLVLVLDGLDERLVHFHRAQQQEYMSALLRVFPMQAEAGSPVRLLLSCRSHYFESLSSQSGFLLDAHRGRTASGDYRAVELLPFNDKQMQALLQKRIGDAAGAIVWAMLEANPPLKNLASRPWLLNLLSYSHETLKRQQRLAQPLDLATVFDAIIEDTLSRDDEKHLLHRRHKRRLLQDLAAHLWRRSSQQIGIDALNNWFQHWLGSSGLRDQYPGAGDQALVLEKDLRNSSLLVRSGEHSFGFGHSAMQEFFLAKWLVAELHGEAEQLRSIEHLPSKETLAFLQQLLHASDEHQPLYQGMARLLADETSSVAARELVLKVLVTQPALAALGFPHIDLSGLDCYAAAIDGIHCQRLTLRNSRFEESRWRGCHIQVLVIADSLLFGSAFVGCTLAAVELHGDNNLRQITLADTPAPALAPYGAHRYPAVEPRLAADKRWDRALPPLMHGHQGSVDSIAFDRGGQRLASGGQDGTVKLWDAANGHCLQTRKAHQGGVLSVAFDPNGQRLASGGDDGTVKIWDAANGACLQTIQAHQEGVISVAFDPSGQRLAFGGDDGTLTLWDAASGDCLRTFKGHTHGVTSVAFDPSGQRLVSASAFDDGPVKLWDAASGACWQTFQVHQDFVLSVAFAPDGQQLAFGVVDGTVQLWDAASGACLQILQGHQSWVASIAFDASGQRLASGGNDGTLKRWDTVRGVCLQTIQAKQTGVESVAFAPSGQCLASGGADGTLKLWDAASGACLQTFGTHKNFVLNVAFDPSGQRFVSGWLDGTVQLWDTARGACLQPRNLQTRKVHEEWGESVAFDASGQCLASGGLDGTLKLWDTASGACLQTLQTKQLLVQSVAFDPSGQRLASGGTDGTLKRWDAANGACLQTIQAHQGWVLSVAFDRSGQYLASASDDGTVKLWDAASGACLQTLDAHQAGVQSVAFDARGQYLASGGEQDGTVKLWDAASGSCLQTIDAHQAGVQSVAFDASGQHLASGGRDGTVKLWQLNPDGAAATLQKTLMAFPDNQWLCLDHVQNCVTSTELAWRYVNFSDGQQAAAIDAFAHRYVRSAVLKLKPR